MYYLSFDAANKTLGYVVCSNDKKYVSENGVMDYKQLQMKFLYFGVVDLFPGRLVGNTTAVERTIELNKFLKTIKLPEDANMGNTVVVIEYQMGQNHKSHSVQDQIMMFYVDRARVEIIGPSAKNGISFTEELRIQRFMEKYKTAESANKNQTAENLRFLSEKTKLPINHISNDLHNHVADAFMQLLWILIEKK